MVTKKKVSLIVKNRNGVKAAAAVAGKKEIEKTADEEREERFSHVRSGSKYSWGRGQTKKVGERG